MYCWKLYFYFFLLNIISDPVVTLRLERATRWKFKRFNRNVHFLKLQALLDTRSVWKHFFFCISNVPLEKWHLAMFKFKFVEADVHFAKSFFSYSCMHFSLKKINNMTCLDKPHECLTNPFSLKPTRTATTANETPETRRAHVWYVYMFNMYIKIWHRLSKICTVVFYA